jgi:tRNA(Ile)-lysidine synthase
VLAVGQPPRPDAADPVVAALLARCTFGEPGTRASCAVSGGADSTALAALAIAHGLRVTLVHVDHGLRPDSAHEADAVAQLAARWGASFRAEVAHVAPGSDLEARARDARRRVLPDDALFGHTADDQAETVLLRLLRGTGPFGLGAMRSDRHPLLALRRAETRSLCAHLGVEVLQDPTNTDARFVRNRVRHEVLPLLDDVADRDVVPLLCRLATLSAEQSDLLEELAEGIDPRDAGALATAPRPLAVAAVRRWWSEETGSSHPPERSAIHRVLQVAAGDAPRADVTGGWQVARTAGRLRLEPTGRGGPTHAGLGSGADD